MTAHKPADAVAAAAESKRSIGGLIEQAALAGAVVFPLAPALVVVCSAGYSQGLLPPRVCAVVAVFAALLIALMWQEARLCSHKPWRFFIQALTCTLLAVAIRAVVLGQLQTVLSSDFARAQQTATEFIWGPTKNLYAARYPYWGLFATVLSYVYRVFGNDRVVYQGFNLACAGLTTLALCYAGRTSSRSPAVGLVAGILFATWPTLVVYSSLLTPEHLFIMLFPCAYLAFEHTGAHSQPRARLAWLTLTGALIGLMDSFKPVGVALLIACLIALILREVLSETPERLIVDRAPQTARRQHMLWIGLLMMVLGGSYEATKRACNLLVEHQAGYPANTAGLGETLRVGLDPSGNGNLTPAIGERLEEVREHYGADFEAANQTLMDETLRIVAQNSSRMPLLLVDKFAYLWSSDKAVLQWAMRPPPGKAKLKAKKTRMRRNAGPWLHSYWLLVLSLACAGTLRGAFYRPRGGIVIFALFTSGVAAILLLTEAQQRYRSVLAPALAVLAAYGVLAVSRCLGKATRAAMARWFPKVDPNQ